METDELSIFIQGKIFVDSILEPSSKFFFKIITYIFISEENGLYTFRFKTEKSGMYFVNIDYENKPISISPIVISVIDGILHFFK